MAISGPKEGPLAGGSQGDWTRGNDGIFSGPGGAKHYGDTQPKIIVGSVKEALGMLKEADPTVKIPDTDKAPVCVSSKVETVDTHVVNVGGKIVVSGPLARKVSQIRGIDMLFAGEMNPVLDTKQPDMDEET